MLNYAVKSLMSKYAVMDRRIIISLIPSLSNVNEVFLLSVA